MKYFWIQHSANLKEVGVFPQCTDAKNFTEIQKFGLGYFDKISKPFLLPEPILRNNAKQTDLLYVVPVSSPVFLVISDDLINYIVPEISGIYQKWKLSAYFKGNLITKYNLFHLSNPSQKHIIDFKNSEFRNKNNKTKEEKLVGFSNYQDYHKKWEDTIYSNGSILIKSLTIDLRDMENDIFRIIELNFMGIGYYVSEKLKNKLENIGFTGIQFIPIDEIDPRIKVIY
ncbi:hypothetical protein [Aquiflexum sp.]|uniref:hypothetical protein n=1 Tax=Aquiflexum sp. TaxID=1872584 RepID=UPI00359468D4